MSGRGSRRRRVGRGAALMLTMLPGTAVAEGVARGDREPPSPARIEARVDEAFAVLPVARPRVEPEVPVAVTAVPPSPTPAAPRVSVAALPRDSVAALPQVSVAALPPGGTLAYAADTGAVPGMAALERATTAMPSARVTVAVPLPKRRPTPPPTTAEEGAAVAGETRVASLGVDVGPTPARAEPAPILAEDGVFGEPKVIPKEARPYLDLLRREAAANKVPLWLAVGVGWVESKYQPNLRGTHGVVGLMQVMPSTARYQGYKGPTEKLIEPETNIVWGMRELGWTWKEAKGDACLAIAKYKGGVRTKTISQAARDYCTRARKVTGMG